MRYCPNTNCPFLLEIGTVAEYQDAVQACFECDTALVDGVAPPLVPTAASEQKADTAALQTVVSVETFSEARAIKNELETMRIAAKIVVHEPDEQIDADSAAEETDAVSSLFDVLVLPHHVVPAMDVINTHFFGSDFEPELKDMAYGASTDERFDENEWVREGLAFLDEDEFGPAEQAESDSNQVIGLGNNFLLVALLGLLLLAIAALAYGLMAW